MPTNWLCLTLKDFLITPLISNDFPTKKYYITSKYIFIFKQNSLKKWATLSEKTSVNDKQLWRKNHKRFCDLYFNFEMTVEVVTALWSQTKELHMLCFIKTWSKEFIIIVLCCKNLQSIYLFHWLSPR